MGRFEKLSDIMYLGALVSGALCGLVFIVVEVLKLNSSVVDVVVFVVLLCFACFCLSSVVFGIISLIRGRS